jgi:hypothetical protein
MENIIDDIEEIPTFTIRNDREDVYEMLRSLPENKTMYKCMCCNYIFDTSQGGYANILMILRGHAYCPRCGMKNPELMCKVDAYSVVLKLKGFKCGNGDIVAGAELCPVCNRSFCPKCHNHSVVALSRVTGYVQSVDGWNNGKKQELKDRQRYAIMA